jgi:hypothetical protein
MLTERDPVIGLNVVCFDCRLYVLAYLPNFDFVTVLPAILESQSWVMLVFQLLQITAF